MSSIDKIDLTACDLEPIHIPGSIQPDGVLFIVELNHGTIVGHAGKIDPTSPLLGQKLEAIVPLNAEDLAERTPRTGVEVSEHITYVDTAYDVVSYLSDGHLVVELLPRDSQQVLDAAYLSQFHHIEARLERAGTLDHLAAEAAKAFHQLTGYDRVLIYRFVDDQAGQVVGEFRSEELPSFLNHHFPASDIPRQARALYVRNKVRVISDVAYKPQPIISASSAFQSIDLSDSMLRSVSPIHIQYLKNMGISASASMSIIKDGELWGLVACHHSTPRTIPLAVRLACETLATSLSHILKLREESEYYQQRIRLRTQEDSIISSLGTEQELSRFFNNTCSSLAQLLDAEGFAAVQGDEVFRFGSGPSEEQIKHLVSLINRSSTLKPFVTSSLSSQWPDAENYRDTASGLLVVTMPTEVPTSLLWFRAEHLQTVNWAGNPHKDTEADPTAVLNPRSSFEAWAETVRGRARAWTLAETESASRVTRLLLDARNTNRIRQLNRELTATAQENETLLRQKDFLLREVNHRVQNSLSIVAAFLRMQSRGATAEARLELQQAERRLMAVSLAHRRLYQDESVEVIDLSRYLEELIGEFFDSLDNGWRKSLRLDLAPVLIQTDKAVTLGLVLNELLTNLAKYAYDGQTGPALVTLTQNKAAIRLTVTDNGRGMGEDILGTGFGQRMLQVLLTRLDGKLSYEPNDPGTRAVVTAPINSEKD